MHKKIPKFLKSKKVILLVLTIFAVLFFITRGSGDKSQIQTSQVSQKDIESKISASGTTKADDSSTLKFLTSGKIVWINVKEGDTVTKGQAIAALDREPFDIALRQAQQDVNNTDAVLSQVYDEQKKQTAAENFDQKIRRTAAETAKNKAYDSMKKAEFDLRNANIYSPQEGTVTKINFKVGEEVTSTSEVAEIDDLSQTNFTAQIDETDVGKITTDQNAAINLDAYENQPINAQVEKISPKAIISSTGSTVFEVTFSLPQNSQSLLGLNGEAEITIEKKSNVITVPTEAIVEEKFVWVKEGNQITKKEVQVGIQSDTETEIKSGLQKGQEIVTSGFDQIGKKSILQKLLEV